MKRHLMIALMAVAAVALVAAPGWAAGGRVLSDRQLDGIHAGSHEAADSSASGEDFDISSAAASASTSTAKAAEASNVEYAIAVDIKNKCSATNCDMTIEEDVSNDATTGTNAQTIVNTLLSTNAVQINVAAAGGDQSNIAFSAEGAIGEIDSDQAAFGDAFADAFADALEDEGASVASAASATSASAATALAFATPQVKVRNKCSSDCSLTIQEKLTNSSDGTVNAQSILNTVVSTNAIQINVSGTGTGAQSNVAYSTFSAPSGL